MIMDKIIKTKDNRYIFRCPGCNNLHSINDKIWTFNGNLENPTIKPSILNPNARCHSFVTEGEIKFLNDSTHELAGKTVDLYPVDKNHYNMELVKQMRGAEE